MARGPAPRARPVFAWGALAAVFSGRGGGNWDPEGIGRAEYRCPFSEPGSEEVSPPPPATRGQIRSPTKCPSSPVSSEGHPQDPQVASSPQRDSRSWRQGPLQHHRFPRGTPVGIGPAGASPAGNKQTLRADVWGETPAGLNVRRPWKGTELCVGSDQRPCLSPFASTMGTGCH